MERQRSRAWDWVALSFLCFVVALIATVPVILFVEQVLRLPHAAGLASWTISQVFVSGAVTLFLGRMLLRPPARSNRWAWIVLGVGAALSAIVWVVLVAWSVARFGSFEVDQSGLTAFLYAGVAGVAVAGFATLIAPTGAKRPPWITTVIATVVTALIAVGNVPGALDGIAPDSIPLAVAIGAALAYALVVTILTGRTVRNDRAATFEPGTDSHVQTGGGTLPP